MTTETNEYRAELGSATSGHLVLANGVENLVLGASDSPDELYRATFEGIDPEVRVDGGKVRVEYPQVFNPLKWRHSSADIRLNPNVPWTIEVRGGASDVAAKLSGLRLAGFRATGGVSNVRLELPEPSDDISVEVAGGVSNFAVRRPKGTAASLDLTGGASNLAFDDQQFGAIGGKVSLKSPRYDTETDGRYDVSVVGGASNLSLTSA